MKTNKLILFLTFILAVSIFDSCTDLDKPILGMSGGVLKSAFNFSTTPDCDCPFYAKFENQSENAISYEWDFGDGSAKSTLANPTHCYGKAQEYTVILKAIDGAESKISQNKLTYTPLITFEKTYNLPFDYDVAASVIPSTDGYIVLCSSTQLENNIFIMKIPLDGNWVSSTSSLIQFTDLTGVFPNKMIKTSENGYLVLGSYNNGNGQSQFLLIKYDKDLKKLWHKTYSFGNQYAYPSDVVETTDGRYLVSGSSEKSGVVVKIRIADGSIDDYRLIDQTGLDRIYFYGVNLVPNTNLYVALASYYSANKNSFFIKRLKIDLTPNDANINLIPRNSGNNYIFIPFKGGYVVGGNETAFGWLTKIDALGVEVSTPTNFGAGSVFFKDIKEACNERLIVAGAQNGKAYSFLVDNNLTLLDYYQNATEGGFYNSIIQTPDGGYIAVGEVNSQILVTKLNNTFDR